MKWSTGIIALPIYALTATALAIPSSALSHDATAGSIAQPNITSAFESAVGELEVEYEKLEALKWQLFELHHKIAEQEHTAWLLLNKDFRTCSGLGCLQTAFRKVPDYFQFLKTHLRHKPANATDAPWDCPWSNKKPDEKPLIDTPPPPPTEDSDASSFQRPPPPAHHPGDGPNFHRPPPPSHDDEPPRPFPTRDPEPPFHHPPPHDHEGRPHDHEGKPHPHDGPPPPHPHHKPHHPFHMPHPAPRYRHFKLILATAGTVVSVFIFAILFKACRLYFANPRVQADRAARIEECRTRREYRRAACQHRARQFFSRFGRRGRSNSRNEDYEEKRAMLQRSNSASQIESHIVGADINSLRRAHEIVGQLMRAEEGRLGQDSSSGNVTPSSSRSVRSLQTVTTLPAYAPPPPRYSQELSRDLDVVDGFRYTPTRSEATEIASSASSFVMNDDDLCTESSVVDCQSRMSLDTASATPSVAAGRSKKSLELAGDRFRGQYD